MRAISVALAAPLLLAACAASDSGAGSPGSPSPSSALPPSLDPGSVPPELFDAIVADASSRANVDVSGLTVVTAAAVTWSDGSLGCPEPGMAYTQALVPGYRVILETARSRYDYHASRRGNFSLCPPGRAKPPVDDEI